MKELSGRFVLYAGCAFCVAAGMTAFTLPGCITTCGGATSDAVCGPDPAGAGGAGGIGGAMGIGGAVGIGGTAGTVAGGSGGSGGAAGNAGSTGTAGSAGNPADASGPNCGGFAGRRCPDPNATFCDYDEQMACGEGDATGVCTPRPTICSRDCPGTCGCDGKFYCNACEAHRAGADDSPMGSCSDAGNVKAR